MSARQRLNLRQLKTLVMFMETQSFAGAGDRVGLSHSAISAQMLGLEAELGARLFDRSSRPPTLTQDGARVAQAAREILDHVERLRQIALGQDAVREVAIGFVPTALPHILPYVLACLREDWPHVQIGIKSGLSGELAAAVIQRELDFALITMPATELRELSVTGVAREPLFVVGPRSLSHIESDAEMVMALPFISFYKRAWLGQQIAVQLQARGLHPREGMEVDSVDTIETLVAEGFGVSVVPQRLLAPPLTDRLTRLPFGAPNTYRMLALIEHADSRHTEFRVAMRRLFSSLGRLPSPRAHRRSRHKPGAVAGRKGGSGPT